MPRQRIESDSCSLPLGRVYCGESLSYSRVTVDIPENSREQRRLSARPSRASTSPSHLDANQIVIAASTSLQRELARLCAGGRASGAGWRFAGRSVVDSRHQRQALRAGKRGLEQLAELRENVLREHG